MTKSDLIDKTIKQIEITNKSIELLNLSNTIKYKSIDSAKELINQLTYNDCLTVLARCRNIPVELINAIMDRAQKQYDDNVIDLKRQQYESEDR